MSDWNRLGRHAKVAVKQSQELAVSLGATLVHPEHLLISLMEDTGSTAMLLFTLSGVQVEQTREILEERLQDRSDPGEPSERPAMGPELRRVVQEAVRLAGITPVQTEHLALACLEPGAALTAVLCGECGIDPVEVQRQFVILQTHELRTSSGLAGSIPAAAPMPAVTMPAVTMPAVTMPAVTMPAVTMPAVTMREPPRPAPGVGEGAVEYGRSAAPSADRPSDPSARAIPGGRASMGVVSPGMASTGAASPESGVGAGEAAPVPAGVHTLLALARLVVDLSRKAGQAALESGNTALAGQLDLMRTEVENQMRAARPVSQMEIARKKERVAP